MKSSQYMSDMLTIIRTGGQGLIFEDVKIKKGLSNHVVCIDCITNCDNATSDK